MAFTSHLEPPHSQILTFLGEKGRMRAQLNLMTFHIDNSKRQSRVEREIEHVTSQDQGTGGRGRLGRAEHKPLSSTPTPQPTDLSFQTVEPYS